jgi:NAD(P)-dependent dehydrogenase (short-subunit alcohol dehydrogenase family)
VTIPDYASRPIRGSGTYVVAGGLGGIGRELCRWIASQGDGIHIVALSRSRSFSNSKAALDLGSEIEKLGATLHLVSCDVSKEHEVKNAVEFCKKTLPPIRGVVQGAMVLRVGI